MIASLTEWLLYADICFISQPALMSAAASENIQKKINIKQYNKTIEEITHLNNI